MTPTIPLICWVVACGGFMNCKTYRVEVSSARACELQVQRHDGFFSRAQGHLLPITTWERYEIECGPGGKDCKDETD